ncbi:MAG: hypothetical protein COW84_07340 [Gammaproteobacteria bacterium CG22_combo_CG10-13_8_21_14_all_40_8]|nr:MAG: hypothetical protein COW84_07340 [Gammaproteobacteria bacterium CG22_combo_CG10-13_8_21_14_all_40_8]
MTLSLALKCFVFLLSEFLARATARMVTPEKLKLSPYAIKLITPPVCLVFLKNSVLSVSFVVH